MAQTPVNLSLDGDWLEYLRDVAWWTRGTLLTLLDQGARRELAELLKASEYEGEFPPEGEKKREIPKPRGEKPKIAYRTKFDGKLHEQLKRASYWTTTPYSSIVVAGTDKIVKELEKKHNKGKAFAKRERELPSSPKKKEES